MQVDTEVCFSELVSFACALASESESDAPHAACQVDGIGDTVPLGELRSNEADYCSDVAASRCGKGSGNCDD